jgi:hypothetical protein
MLRKEVHTRLLTSVFKYDIFINLKLIIKSSGKYFPLIIHGYGKLQKYKGGTKGIGERRVANPAFVCAFADRSAVCVSCGQYK